nr:hypothetical protein [Actinoplanes subtropicus]
MLDRDVPMDKVGPLTSGQVTGSFTSQMEKILAEDPGLLASAARALVDSHFPDTVAPDVLTAVGLDPETVLHVIDTVPDPTGISQRRRDPLWREAIIQVWDRQCAFCGFDGQILGATVGIDVAHVRGSRSTARTSRTTGWRYAPCTTSCSTGAHSAWT